MQQPTASCRATRPGALLEVRRGMNEPPDEEALRALLDALLGALRAFHHDRWRSRQGHAV